VVYIIIIKWSILVLLSGLYYYY